MAGGVSSASVQQHGRAIVTLVNSLFSAPGQALAAGYNTASGSSTRHRQQQQPPPPQQQQFAAGRDESGINSFTALGAGATQQRQQISTFQQQQQQPLQSQSSRRRMQPQHLPQQHNMIRTQPMVQAQSERPTAAASVSSFTGAKNVLFEPFIH